jgi:hypothetical protein
MYDFWAQSDLGIYNDNASQRCNGLERLSRKTKIFLFLKRTRLHTRGVVNFYSAGV